MSKGGSKESFTLFNLTRKKVLLFSRNASLIFSFTMILFTVDLLL